MMELTERANASAVAEGVLSLPFETRQKSRFRAHLTDGREVAVRVARGQILRDGMHLTGPDEVVVRVVAADEAVSTASHHEPQRLVRAAYHLGNRHVALQLGDGWLRYYADHVLDQLSEALGLAVRHESAPFEPEGGVFDGETVGGHHHASHG